MSDAPIMGFKSPTLRYVAVPMRQVWNDYLDQNWTAAFHKTAWINNESLRKDVQEWLSYRKSAT
jgi:hypothetical protein